MDADQARVLEWVKSGNNVFFSGSAGVGKTYMLNEIVEYLKAKYGTSFAKKVAKAAMTGIAASHIDGVTLNAALGLGIPRLVTDIGASMSKRAKMIRDYDVMIIDECSMLSGEMLYLIERELRIIRKEPGKFAGGIQLIFCGDFFQLSPIMERNAKNDEFANFGMAFECDTWAEAFRPEDCFLLKKIYRQSDEDFVKTLQRIRVGDNALGALSALVEECSRELECPEGIKPTLIYPLNADIDKINERELGVLPGDDKLFASRDSIVPAKLAAASAIRDTKLSLTHPFFKTCQAPNALNLKVGAQVMLSRNIDVENGLCNGSRGVVIGFKMCEESAADGFPEIPVVRFMDGHVMAVQPMSFEHVMPGIGTCMRIQLPLRLAWAISAHKSQGMTLDAAKISLKGIFAPGQAYVALSRARSKKGLQIVDWDGMVIPANSLVKDFYNRIETNTLVQPSTRWQQFAKKKYCLDDICLFVD